MPKHKTEYIQVCPKCKSADIGFDPQTNILQAIGVPGMQICNACGHLGRMFPEVSVAELEEVRSRVHGESPLSKAQTEQSPVAPRRSAATENQSKVDISYGRFEIVWMWKVGAPLLVALSIYGFYLGFWPSIFFLLLGLWMAYITYFKKVK